MDKQVVASMLQQGGQLLTEAIRAGFFRRAKLEQAQTLTLESQELAESEKTAAVQETIGYVWPGLIVVALLSIVLAAIAYQWHSKYHRPNRAAWTVMVLLTTLPGFLAYWIMHCRPPICGCEACGEQVPSDRDACAACGESLAEPRVRDTSILVPPGAHLS